MGKCRASYRIRDYDFAKTMLILFAQSDLNAIAPMAYYDDDSEFADALGKKFGIQDTHYLQRKMFTVCNMLCHYGIFCGRMVGTQKYYYGEPAKQREFFWVEPSYRMRLAPGKYPHYTPMMPPGAEADFILRRIPGGSYHR